MRDRKVLFISTKFQNPRQSSIVAASHNIPWGPELPRGQNYPTLPYVRTARIMTGFGIQSCILQDCLNKFIIIITL